MPTNPGDIANRLKAPFDPGDVVTTDRLNAYMDEGRPMLNNYTRHAKIGGGHHGEVYLCYYTNTRYPQGHPDRRVPVAMKSVKRDNARAKQLKQLRQQRLPTSAHTPIADRLGTTEAKIRKEIAIMKKCRHPHVVRLYEIIDDRMKEKIYMVMEYLAGGEVKWRNEHNQPVLTVDQTRRIIRDAVLGLEYLHYQGIIHRDIKPANLLWTEDRRQVKIADFGVSHFSYAQRLAAAGKEGLVEDPEDPILLDDSDLTRRAGTPSFLAPEIVYEHTEPVGSSSSSTVPITGSSSIPQASTSHSLSTQRPPITKSIDIWALGITLYCLLFGQTPFTADPAAAGSEWSLYNSICNQDWTVDDMMGSDRIPTGERHPTSQESEGAIVVHLLDRLLQKDLNARITLEEVKSSRWILRNLPEPEKWLQLTRPKGKIDVSVDEASDAITKVRFTWNWGAVTRRISSLFRRSRDQNPDDQDARGPVRSEPHARIRRHKSITTEELTLFSSTHSKQDKGKQSQRNKPRPPKRPSSKSLQAGSFERWPVVSSADAASSSTPAIQEPTQVSQGRRGSTTALLVGDRNINTNTNSLSSQSSPTTSDKPRTRWALFLSSISHWRPNKYSPYSSSPTDTPGASTSSAQQKRKSGITNGSGRITRRSEEALRYYRSTSTEPSGPLTADRRASSWGQGDQPIEFVQPLGLNSSFSLDDRAAKPGPSYICGDRLFTPRIPSRLTSNVPAAVSHPNQEAPGKGADKEEQQFGPACIDDDSSTIASAFEDDGDTGEWQNGSDLENDGAVYEEDGGSDDQEAPVTFSPRRREPAQD